MRLIDADKLIDYFYYGINDRPVIDGYSDRKVIDIINEQPTAYDVDKVVERLKQLKDIKVEVKCYCTDCSYYDRCEKVQENIQSKDEYDLCELMLKDLVFEIIKSGGVE